MSAGTVISGGFPGRVAQEVQPNPKCNGCLHYDGQAGRTGACTIGLRPWLCGDGEAADIGYAPLVRGAGTYLPGMSNRSAQAPQVGPQETDELTGAGSVRPVTFQQVSLGEEHVHFVKSLVSQHTAMQKSICRLCQSSNMIGTAPANVGYQVCTCAPIEARAIAKSLMSRLNNRERSVIDMSDLTAFVYACAKFDFDPSIAKATFYHQHGKYEVSPSGRGEHHVDFHPRSGGSSTRVGTFGTRREARHAAERHHQRFASGSGTGGAVPQEHAEAPTRPVKRPSDSRALTLPSMRGAVSVAKKGRKAGVGQTEFAPAPPMVSKGVDHPDAPMHVKRMHAFVKEHGFHATAHEDHVKIHIPYRNVHTGEEGVDVFHAKNMKQVRQHLGY